MWANLHKIGVCKTKEQVEIPIGLDILNGHFTKLPTIDNVTDRMTTDELQCLTTPK